MKTIQNHQVQSLSSHSINRKLVYQSDILNSSEWGCLCACRFAIYPMQIHLVSARWKCQPVDSTWHWNSFKETFTLTMLHQVLLLIVYILNSYIILGDSQLTWLWWQRMKPILFVFEINAVVPWQLTFGEWYHVYRAGFHLLSAVCFPCSFIQVLIILNTVCWIGVQLNNDQNQHGSQKRRNQVLRNCREKDHVLCYKQLFGETSFRIQW